MKLLEMVKDKKIKHNVSHPHSKVREDFFLLNMFFIGEQTFLGKFMGN